MHVLASAIAAAAAIRLRCRAMFSMALRAYARLACLFAGANTAGRPSFCPQCAQYARGAAMFSLPLRAYAALPPQSRRLRSRPSRKTQRNSAFYRLKAVFDRRDFIYRSCALHVLYGTACGRRWFLYRVAANRLKSSDVPISGRCYLSNALRKMCQIFLCTGSQHDRLFRPSLKVI